MKILQMLWQPSLVHGWGLGGYCKQADGRHSPVRNVLQLEKKQEISSISDPTQEISSFNCVFNFRDAQDFGAHIFGTAIIKFCVILPPSKV